MPESWVLGRLGESPLDTVRLDYSEHHAALTLQGAHLVSCVHGGEERLWLGPESCFEPGKAIRGGVPVCWPWFGAHPNDDSRPAHGFARTSLWTVLDSGATKDCAFVMLHLKSPDPSYPLQADYRIELNEAGLRMSLTTTHLGHEAVTLTEALHTYLPVSDIAGVTLQGLRGCEYADKLLGYQRATDDREAVSFADPIDRVYFDSSESLSLVDLAWRRTTSISKRGSAATVVWNAGETIASAMPDLGAEHYRGYVCVEAANALDAGVLLQGGATHSIEQFLQFGRQVC